VVIGQESSGKSTLLERLAMMPIFPRDRRLCTRLPIHVRLRNVDKCEAATLEVHNVKTGTTEEAPYIIPVEYGAIDVREKMQEIIEKEHGNAAGGVSTERVIILTVKSPWVPSIDLIDLPGLVTTPESMKQGTRQLIEDHIAKHGQYSLYLATVVATCAPNQSCAMEIVQSKQLAGKTIGVFTKCDHAMAIDDEKEMFEDRLKSPPAPDCGAVPLKPFGWICVKNAHSTSANDMNSFARLRQQAVDEDAFMRKKLPQVVAAGDAGCSALVERISKQFMQFLSKSWAPNTIKLLNIALEDAAIDNALMGMPEFRGTDKTHAKRARELAVKEARRKIETGAPELLKGWCTTVLQGVKDNLLSIACDVTAREASQVPAVWSAQKKQFERACERAVDSWGSYWAKEIHELMVKHSKPETREAKKLLMKRPQFVLERFPAFVRAAVDSVKNGLQLHKKELTSMLKAVIDTYYAKMSPWVEIETDFRDVPTVAFRCNKNALVENIMYCFVEHSTQGILDELKSKLTEISSGICDDHWVENCAKERDVLDTRIKNLTDAKAQILKLLGHKSEKELITID
jgi:hypothetical protein